MPEEIFSPDRIDEMLNNATIEPEVIEEEPPADNSELNQPDNSKVEEEHTTEPPNDESKKTEEPKVPDTPELEEPKQVPEPKYSEGFLKKFEGKTQEQLLDILYNNETYVGKIQKEKETEIARLKSELDLAKVAPKVQVQEIDWENPDQAIQKLAIEEMRLKSPDFNGTETIDDMHGASPTKAFELYNDYQKALEKSKEFYTEIKTIRDNQGKISWDNAVRAIDIAEEILSEMDFKLDDIFTNEKLSEDLKEIKEKYPDFKDINTLKENFALFTLLNEKGEYDKNLFDNIHGISVIKDPMKIVNKILHNTKEQRQSIKEARKAALEEKIKQEKFEAEKKARGEGFEKAKSIKPSPTLTSVEGGVIDKPKGLDLNKPMSPKQIDEILKQAGKLNGR